MAADLHIHVFSGITTDDLRQFFSHTIGSKYFAGFGGVKADIPMETELAIAKRITDAPNIWIGEVSWLKAALTEDEDTFVPTTVAEVHTIIGEELPVVTEELITKIKAAFTLENTTGYRLASVTEVEEFLRKHMGEKLFTVSW